MKVLALSVVEKLQLLQSVGFVFKLEDKKHLVEVVVSDLIIIAQVKAQLDLIGNVPWWAFQVVRNYLVRG